MKNKNRFAKLAMILFLIGTAMICANTFLSGVLVLSEGIWRAILIIGTGLDLVAGVTFLHSKKVDNDSY